MLIVVHGGAGTIEAQHHGLKLAGVKQAVRAGWELLASGGSAVDAVERAVTIMENDPIMNCGYGSSLTIEGTVECDAIVMDGRQLTAGAVAGVKHIRHPISLARAVMEKTEHCLLISDGAEQLAREIGMPLVENKSLVHEWAQQRLNEYMTFNQTVSLEYKPKQSTGATNASPDRGHDTVGAVVIDGNGNCAVATSTGGLTAKRVGRVGDSPIIGAGGYADNTLGAVSTTGHGESIMKTCLASHILWTHSGNGGKQSLQQSMDQSLKMMANKVNGFGGAIAVASDGQLGISFSTDMMAWAYIDSKDDVPTAHYGLTRGQHLTEKF